MGLFVRWPEGLSWDPVTGELKVAAWADAGLEIEVGADRGRLADRRVGGGR